MLNSELKFFNYCLISSFLYIYSMVLPFSVVIDPGHGGKFQGAVSASGAFFEKDAALDVALRCASLLNKKNIKTTLTRINDRDFGQTVTEDLQSRISLINSMKADVFISIHFNYSPKKALEGFEVYVPYKDVIPLESYNLASFIHFTLSKAIPASWSGSLGNFNNSDRGIRAAKYNVLAYNESKASILLELEYISSSSGEQRIARSSYKDMLAKALVEGVLSYHKSKIS